MRIDSIDSGLAGAVERIVAAHRRERRTKDAVMVDG